MHENEWIKTAQKGDNDAFCELISTYESKIYNIAYKFMRNTHDAQDAAQEAIIKMYANLSKFHFNASFSTWMYRVVANTCLDLLRKQKSSVPIEDYADFMISKEGNPDEKAINHELRHNIRQALKLLPQKYMEIIVLRDVQGLSYEEVSKILKLSDGTVKSRLSRGRQKLKNILIEKKILD
ncbi:MAG: sigma-70 family RNA polymerase sigma factor [Christensenellaceae bacterium]